MSEVQITPVPDTAKARLLDGRVRDDIESIRQAFAPEIAERGKQGAKWFSLDPGGYFQTRKDTLNHFIQNGEFDGQSFNLGLNARLLGITDADVAAGILDKQQQARNNQFGGVDSDYGIKQNTLTSDAEILKQIKTEDNLRAGDNLLTKNGVTISDINALGGAQLDPGKRYTTKQLSSAVTQVLEQRRRDGNTADARTPGGAVEQLEVQKDANQKSHEISLTQLSDNRVNAKNTLDFNRWVEEGRRADAAAGRKDKMDLALLNLKEKRLDRAYLRERDRRADDRADREKRLALIMQAIKGIGGGFAAF